MKIKACKICGKWFVAKGRAECCSNECKKENIKIKNRKASNKWYGNNKEKKARLNKEWNENNKELRKELNKEWNENNKELRKELNKKWNENNKELRKELNKKWNENNKEDRKAFNNDINAEKLAKQRAYCREYGGYFDNNKWHQDSDRGRVKESLEERKEKLMSKWGALYE